MNHRQSAPFLRATTAKKAALLAIAGLVTTSLLAPGLVNAKIYKLVDEDGNVSYTDVAPTDTERREKSALELNIENTYRSGESNPSADSTGSGESSGGEEGGEPGDIIVTDEQADSPTTTSAGYKSITITSPATDAALRSNNGNISLGVRLDPALRAGDQVRFFLDGKPVGTVSGTSLALTNVDRGTHTLAAVVLDSNGKLRKSSRTETFTLQRYTKRLAP